MKEFTIGEVAKRTGLAASTIRYYESENIVPEPARRGGRRIYDEDWMNHLGFVMLAQETGFSIKQIRNLIKLTTNKNSQSSQLWKAAIIDQQHELHRRRERIQQMEDLLDGLMTCKCASIKRCGEIALKLLSSKDPLDRAHQSKTLALENRLRNCNKQSSILGE